MSTKGLKLKGGKVIIEDKKKDLRIRKNYSLPEVTINKIKEISDLLGNNSESETIVEIVNIVDSLLVVEEPKKVAGTRRTRRTTKKEEGTEESTVVETEEDK